MKRIKSQSDLETWQSSPAFKELNEFLDRLFSEICGKKLSQIPGSTDSKCLNWILGLLDEVEVAVNEIEAVVEINKSAQRYGNKAFRSLIERMKTISDPNTFLGNVFLNSFGDPIRIDYGTGHELSFIIFVMCSIKSAKEGDIDYAWIGGKLIGQKYMKLVRKIQSKYSLEPAGSHGVWGLDDHQFIPFLLGSSQLIGSELWAEDQPELLPAELIKPQNFSNETITKEYLYAASLNHIHRLKTRSNPSLQFHHHSPLLYDISGVPSWRKIHDGLRRMYEKEVLSKLPVVQHILFDPGLFKYT